MLGKALIPKEEKVVDYHEVHVIGSVHTNPNSNNSLPPFTLNRNGVLSQATKNKTYIPKNICTSASKDRSYGEYLA